MTDPSSKPDNHGDGHHRFYAWFLLPISFFPLAALISYDWRSIAALNQPPVPTSNWIGALGDGFAYYGYLLFGLAIWIIPVFCIIAAFCKLRTGKPGRTRRELWLLLSVVSAACLLQVIGSHGGVVSATTARLNVADAGGAIGYLLMTRLLSPLISDFGSAVLMSILLLISIVAAIGLKTIAESGIALFQWALARRTPVSGADASAATPTSGGGDVNDPYILALRAKEEVRRQREEEKRLAREEKQRAKEEKQRLKEEMQRQREEERLTKEAEKTARAESMQPYLVPPPPPPAPAPAKHVKSPEKPTAPASEPAEDKGPYILPSLDLLKPLKKSTADHGDVGEMTQKLIDTLKLFGVDASLAYTVQGPVVTKYALYLAPGTRYSAVTNISDNLMGALHAKSLRIEAPIPGEECVGIEVPNRAPAGISFREIIESDTWRNFKGELPLLFGKDAAGKDLVADLASMPHMLVAGATGQGKSVCLNSLINGLLMTKTPEQLKLIMVDPKSVEFTSYASLPHLIVPIITENKKVVFSLQWAVQEMEKRLKLFARARVRNIYDFNHRLQFTQTDMFGCESQSASDIPKTVPYIVIIIDEVADLMSQCSKEVSPFIARLTAKARAAGIHLILATQRPDAKIITGAIKANIPGRVAFKTATSIDSRTILDDGGAENLIGRGDMLFKSKDGLLIRAQGAWISDPEIANVVKFIEEHSNVQFDDRFAKKLGSIKEEEVDLFADPEAEAAEQKEEAAAQREQVKADAAASDFKKAVECVINTHRASTSHFQRQMGWGYNHAAKILDMLTERGIVSAPQGMGPRQIVMSQEELLAVFNGDAGADPSAAGNASDDTPPLDAGDSNQPNETFANDEEESA